MADGVQTVLVLSTNVALQSLQDAVGLQDLRTGRVQTRLIPIQLTALLLDRSIACANLLRYFLFKLGLFDSEHYALWTLNHLEVFFNQAES